MTVPFYETKNSTPVCLFDNNLRYQHHSVTPESSKFRTSCSFSVVRDGKWRRWEWRFHLGRSFRGFAQTPPEPQVSHSRAASEKSQVPAVCRHTDSGDSHGSRRTWTVSVIQFYQPTRHKNCDGCKQVYNCVNTSQHKSTQVNTFSCFEIRHWFWKWRSDTPLMKTPFGEGEQATLRIRRSPSFSNLRKSLSESFSQQTTMSKGSGQRSCQRQKFLIHPGTIIYASDKSFAFSFHTDPPDLLSSPFTHLFISPHGDR
jgi:hypothetical protein